MQRCDLYITFIYILWTLYLSSKAMGRPNGLRSIQDIRLYRGMITWSMKLPIHPPIALNIHDPTLIQHPRIRKVGELPLIIIYLERRGKWISASWFSVCKYSQRWANGGTRHCQCGQRSHPSLPGCCSLWHCDTCQCEVRKGVCTDCTLQRMTE